jgi:hydroxymethylpyrimidine kinase/phosphomethylpyrimidine kinase
MAAVLPCALTIGGLDPGGGAGIAADLRAFHAAGVFGCAAVAVITVQSTAGLRSARPIPARQLAAQAEEVLANQRIRAIKVGALGSRENVLAVARILTRPEMRDLPVVLDTPIRPTRGSALLLAPDARAAMRERLMPLATLVTVNLDEVRALLGERVKTVSEAHDAARALVRSGPRAVLVKGGHMTGPLAIDVLAIDDEVIELRARRLTLATTHGTGCTFAALVAGRLARAKARHGISPTPSTPGGTLLSAIRWAKRVHHAALTRAADVGGGLRVISFL